MKKLIRLEVETKSTLDNYIKLLKLFPEWKSISRDLKLNTILNKDQKRQQLNITDIKCSNDMLLLGFFNHGIGQLRNACATIKSIEFTISNNKKIEKLIIEIEPLSTAFGKTLEILNDANILLSANEHIVDDDFKFFYISDSPELQKELTLIIPIACQ